MGPLTLVGRTIAPERLSSKWFWTIGTIDGRRVQQQGSGLGYVEILRLCFSDRLRMTVGVVRPGKLGPSVLRPDTKRNAKCVTASAL